MKINQPRQYQPIPASSVTVADPGGDFTGTDLETILAEIAATDQGLQTQIDGLAVAPIVAVFDNGLSAISGNPDADVYLLATGTITSWTLLADAAGDAVIDIWKDTYANYPPTVADTIAGAEKPTLSGVTKNQDLSLNGGAGWAVTAGDVIRFHLDSSATVKRLTLVLSYTRS